MVSNTIHSFLTSAAQAKESWRLSESISIKKKPKSSSIYIFLLLNMNMVSGTTPYTNGPPYMPHKAHMKRMIINDLFFFKSSTLVYEGSKLRKHVLHGMPLTVKIKYHIMPYSLKQIINLLPYCHNFYAKNRGIEEFISEKGNLF